MKRIFNHSKITLGFCRGNRRPTKPRKTPNQQELEPETEPTTTGEGMQIPQPKRRTTMTMGRRSWAGQM